MAFSFVQIADPQFGMHSQLSGFDNPAVDRLANLGLMVEPMPKADNMDFETANYGKVIDAVNRLRPAFVATCGDMTNDQDNPFEEHAELMRVTAGLSDDIPMHWVSGNHDVRGQPTHESLERYRGMYGDDVYSFDHEDSHFVVLNSTVIKNSANVEDECEQQLAFLERTCGRRARRAAATWSCSPTTRRSWSTWRRPTTGWCCRRSAGCRWSTCSSRPASPTSSRGTGTATTTATSRNWRSW